jgi:acyl-CoA reductase-like NAD-dependent aldehyde dehydrogenase
MRNIISKNPFTGQVKGLYPFISAHELGDKLDRSAVAFEIQKRRTLEERAGLIQKLAKVIEGRTKEISEMITF